VFKLKQGRKGHEATPEEVVAEVEHALGRAMAKSRAMRRAFGGIVPRRDARILAQVDARTRS
jgi:hypothetical protein